MFSQIEHGSIIIYRCKGIEVSSFHHAIAPAMHQRNWRGAIPDWWPLIERFLPLVRRSSTSR